LGPWGAKSQIGPWEGGLAVGSKATEDERGGRSQKMHQRMDRWKEERWPQRVLAQRRSLHIFRDSYRPWAGAEGGINSHVRGGREHGGDHHPKLKKRKSTKRGKNLCVLIFGKNVENILTKREYEEEGGVKQMGRRGRAEVSKKNKWKKKSNREKESPLNLFSMSG